MSGSATSRAPALQRRAQVIFPSSNAYGIPDLDASGQPEMYTGPLVPWGSQRRKARQTGTWCFYTDDYRFEALWSKPEAIQVTGCAAAVEPNFSVFEQSPKAVAIWQTYRKRWLARYWQLLGFGIWVDLCSAHQSVNLLGVPSGWRSFATRGFDERLEDLDAELAIAKQFNRAATLLVYGGGRAVQDWCLANRDTVHCVAPRQDRFRPGEGTRRISGSGEFFGGEQ